MITGKQRAELKKVSQTLEPQLLIGKSGITDNLIEQIKDHLEKNEILKIKVLSNNTEEKDELVSKVLEMTEAEFVSSLGNKFVIYKRNKDKPQVVKLPR